MNIKTNNENGMCIDELIKNLQYIKFMYGNIPITFSTYEYNEIVMRPIFNIRKTKTILFQDENSISYQEESDLPHKNIEYNPIDIIIFE